MPKIHEDLCTELREHTENQLSSKNGEILSYSRERHRPENRLSAQERERNDRWEMEKSIRGRGRTSWGRANGSAAKSDDRKRGAGLWAVEAGHVRSVYVPQHYVINYIYRLSAGFTVYCVASIKSKKIGSLVVLFVWVWWSRPHWPNNSNFILGEKIIHLC